MKRTYFAFLVLILGVILLVFLTGLKTRQLENEVSKKQEDINKIAQEKDSLQRQVNRLLDKQRLDPLTIPAEDEKREPEYCGYSWMDLEKKLVLSEIVNYSRQKDNVYYGQYGLWKDNCQVYAYTVIEIFHGPYDTGQKSKYSGLWIYRFDKEVNEKISSLQLNPTRWINKNLLVAEGQIINIDTRSVVGELDREYLFRVYQNSGFPYSFQYPNHWVINSVTSKENPQEIDRIEIDTGRRKIVIYRNTPSEFQKIDEVKYGSTVLGAKP